MYTGCITCHYIGQVGKFQKSPLELIQIPQVLPISHLCASYCSIEQSPAFLPIKRLSGPAQITLYCDISKHRDTKKILDALRKEKQVIYRKI